LKRQLARAGSGDSLGADKQILIVIFTSVSVEAADQEFAYPDKEK